MAEKTPLPDEIRAVLDRCVGEMRERLVGELEGAETEAEKLEVLARFSREIGNVRGKVSGRAGISIGKRWALIGAGLAVFGVGAATASLWPKSQAATSTAVEAPKGDDEAAAAEGAAGGSSEGTNVLPDDKAQPSREKAVEGDKVIADAASEGNQAALDRAAETLKTLYLRARARLDATKEGDPTKAAKEAEVKRLEDQLRKNRINPDTVKPENNQPVPVIAPQSDPAAPDAAVTPEADGAEPVSPKASNLDEGI